MRAFGEAKSPPSLVPSFRPGFAVSSIAPARRRLAARSHYRNTRRRLRIGELGLLMPALEALTKEDPAKPKKWVSWIAPPFVPYAPALQQHGVNIDRLLMIHPTAGMKSRLWAIEQPCARGRARACWPGSGQPMTSFCGACSWRPRIKDAGCCCFARKRALQRSPAALRIHLSQAHLGNCPRRRPAWRSSSAEVGGRASSI